MRASLSFLAALLAAGVCLGQYGELTGLKILKPEDTEHVKTVEPPKEAKVLLGKSLDGWVKKDQGKDKEKGKAAWKVADGVAEVKGGDIHTTETFGGKFELHVEFRMPYVPEGKDQGRGNSGVYLQGRYEVQVLDSYGIEDGKLGMGDCGSIYGVSIAKKNVCKAPTIWQSYDIEFTSPEGEDGKVTKAGRMTVWFNGEKIHDDVPLVKKNKDGKEEFVTNTTAGMGGDPTKPGPILLQDHGHPVQYRNIWLVQIEK